MNKSLMPFYAWIVCFLAFSITACAKQQPPDIDDDAPVHSFLQGRFTVNAEVDSVADYRGFEVLVAIDTEGEPDTLGYARTDSTGAFQLDVTAPGRGVYALIVGRRGQILNVSELAVAEGDTATVQAVFPTGNRSLRIRSAENAAWMAYKNTKAQHNRNLLTLVQGGAYDDASVQTRVEQTSSILWEMRSTFPNTIGGELAAAESIVMLGGWNDSLALARASTIRPENVSYADVARVVRQAAARLHGQAAALDTLRAYRDRALTDDQRASIQSEIVVAYDDSLQYDEAVAAARALAADYAGTEWATWADRAIYELQNLKPGMAAPSFTATTQEGESLVLDSLRGAYVLLEYYRPQDQVYQRELEIRNALYDAAADSLHIVSVSLEPDTLLNEAFLEGRSIPGYHVFVSEGLDSELARTYNVNVLPTRYLIDAEGNIIGKYVGRAMAALETDVLTLLDNS